ncbi:MULTISPECIES: class C sortase [Clostridia]|uniref:class C sortase n=1 Tax=Clostridia TaxID=186801 RepID=UPI000EA03AE5|nr:MULTISPECIES: class C sortase [Clostridia]NBJ68118.1 class C sortase [Roseburia sp. 1XD42-34]RKI81893.1 class C sortase [Clostridium sp. 1xD42-85]
MKGKKVIILLFVVGLIILVYPHAAKLVNSFLQKQQVGQFQTDLEERSDEEIDALMKKASACNKEIFYDSSGFRDPFEDNKEKLNKFKNCLGIDDDEVFAAIEIPKLGEMIPIFLGATEETLEKGIGQIEGSSLPVGGKSNHTVLAGHRGMGTKAMFRNVDELRDGDVFYIHTISGTLTYQVYNQKVVAPDETEPLEIQENRDLATLFTCHPYPTDRERLLIQAERVEDKKNR